MKRILTAIGICVVLQLAGVAHANTIEESFGNTVVVTTADGRSARYAFNPDHSYTAVLADGRAQAGRWSVEGDQFCMTPNGEARTCQPTPPPGKRVGDTWQAGDADAPITVSIIRGR